MSARRWLIGLLALGVVGAPAAVGAQEAKEQPKESPGKEDPGKEKGEAEEKAAKPKVPSFTDEDLKKYRSTDADKAQPGPSSDTRSRRRSRYGDNPNVAGNDEGQWRKDAAQARRPLKEAQDRVKRIETQMNDLREQLNPMSTRYVLGGNSTAGPGRVYEIEQTLRGLEAELTQAKATLAEAEKAWQTFVDDARAQGASPAWLEP